MSTGRRAPAKARRPLAPRATAADVVAQLRRHGTAARREVATWYFPTALDVLGVANPDMHRVARALAAALRGAPVPEVVAVARALVATRVMEARAAAYEVLGRRKDALATLGARDVEALGKGNDNWGSVDGFAVAVAGPAWRLGGVTDADVARWARSKDRWWRRTALVATVALNQRSRGGTGDPARTLAVCDRLAADPDDMVGKALSWALRALIPHDAAGVAAWLDAHRERVQRRVIREVTTKLRTGRKNPRRAP